MNVKFLVPVRGGSIGVPGKNKRNLMGKPLLGYVIETILKKYNSEDIWLATDDQELKAIVKKYEINVFDLPEQTGKETLDDVAVLFLEFLYESKKISDDDILLTIQATCPLLKVETIEASIERFNSNFKSVITAVDDRHLFWIKNEKGEYIPGYEKRLNRQNLPENFKESGGVIGAKVKDILEKKTRVIEPIALVPVSKEEGLDIDTFNELSVAEAILKKKTIYIKADSSIKIGMGHLYRSLTLAYELAQHHVKIFSNTSGDKKLSSEFFNNPIYDFNEVQSDEEFVNICKIHVPDLVIVDQLNTSKDYILDIKKTGTKVITFEDMGEGAEQADLLISDLYKNTEIADEKQLTGLAHAFLNPSFEWVEPKPFSNKVDTLLLIFGGTDPSNLTEKTLLALKTIEYAKDVIVIQGMGHENKIESLKQYGLNGKVYHNVKFMPELMKTADLAISSAGRTITELMTVGVPTICMCQNKNEMTHSHASMAYGVYNLGLGKLIEHKNLAEHISFIIENSELRKIMYSRAINSVHGRSNTNVIQKIESKINLQLL